jgi:hypothetical protein
MEPTAMMVIIIGAPPRPRDSGSENEDDTHVTGEQEYGDVKIMLFTVAIHFLSFPSPRSKFKKARHTHIPAGGKAI